VRCGRVCVVPFSASKYPSLSLRFRVSQKNLNLEKAAGCVNTHEKKKLQKEQARISNTLTPRKDRQIATKRENMTTLDNSANEFAAFSTILSGFDEEYVSPTSRSKIYQNSGSPTALNSYASPQNNRRAGGGGYGGYKSNNYDPDEPLDVLQEMNKMLEAAERSPTNEKNINNANKARSYIREAYGTFEDSASRLERDLMEKENRMKRNAAEELRRQLDQDAEFSLDMLANGDRATILAREAEILRAEEESLRRVREGAKHAAEKERQRLENERVAHASGRANWVSAENKRRGMGPNARAPVEHEAATTPVQRVQRGSGVGMVTPTRIVPKFTNNSEMEDKENAGGAGSKRGKTTRSSSSSLFNPFKTITNVAVGAKNALLSRENPKQKPKVRRSIIATDEPNENSMNATGPSAVVSSSSYNTPVQESKKRSTILTPVESRETNRGISPYNVDEREEAAEESDVMIAKMISPGQMVYIKKPIEKASDIAAAKNVTQQEQEQKKKKNKKKNKRSLNIHPAIKRVAKAASTIGASFVVVSAVGSYATGARDVRDLQRAARNVQKTTVSVAMFIGKTWKSISKNLMPGVTDEVPTLTPTVVYQRTPNKVVKKTVVLRPHQVGVQPGPSGEDFRRAYGRG
jgi:hypothetical protein